MTRLLSLFAALLFTQMGICQKLMFTNFGTDKGLIQSDINDITQDKLGDIWIATNAGISVFDGQRFKNFDDISQLSSLRVFRIVCDTKGVVWIATDNGLVKYDGKFSVAFKPQNTAYTRITALTHDNRGNKYFLYNRVLFKIANGVDTAAKVMLSIPDTTAITTFNVDANNNFWLTNANKQVYRISKGILTRFPVDTVGCEKNPGPFNFFLIKIFNDTVPYFFTSKGLFVPENGKLIPLQSRFKNYPIKNEAVSFYTSSDETWLGTDNGAFRLSADGIKHFSESNGLSNISITTIFRDREKNIWIGSFGNGVFKLSTHAITALDEALAFNLSNIQSLAKINDGEILLIDNAEGIFRMSKDSISKIDHGNVPLLKYITGFVSSKNSTLIGTFGRGFWELDNHNFTIKKSKINIPEPYINALLPYKKGGIACTGGRFVYSINHQFEIIAKKEMPGILSLFSTNDSNVLFIRMNSKEILNPQLNVVKQNVFPEIKARISCLEYYKDKIFVGTIGQGLFLYNDKLNFIKKIGTKTNIIYSLKATGKKLFIGSNVGLSKSDIDEVINKETYAENNLFNGECKEEGIMLLTDDKLLVISAKGLFIINTKENDFNIIQPVISLKSVNFINGREVLQVNINNTTNQGSIYVPSTIPHNKNELVIGLKGVSQTAPEAIQYQFILENYETKWNTTGNGELIRYTNLQPGSYTFKSRVMANGVASKLLQIAFTIDQPLQSKWWFQVITALLFISVAVLLLNVFNKLNHRFIETKMIKKSTDILLKKKSEIAELIDSTKRDFALIKQEFFDTGNKADFKLKRHLNFYVNNSMNRLDLLWNKNTIQLAGLHKYIEECIKTDSGKNISISHNIANEKLNLPIETAEKIIRLFSLYIFYTCEISNEAVFSLTSKLRLANQLFLKIYSTESDIHTSKSGLYRRLKEYVNEMNTKDFAIEFVESRDLGNMIIVTLTLETAHLINEVSEEL